MTRSEAITQITLIVCAVQGLNITPSAGINGISEVLDNINEEETTQ